MIDQKHVDLIIEITDRAWVKLKNNYEDKLSLMMDVETAYQDCLLDLQKLLDADDFNFYHDIIGIGNNLNRQTKKLENCFLPRYTKQD